MSFNFLLLGHLLGDFTFQTEKIALNKGKSKKLNALHATIVTVSMLFFSLPFGLITLSLVLVSGILHYFIDSTKSRMPVSSPFLTLIQFLVDQLVHISIILLVSFLGEKNQSILFINENHIKIGVMFVFVVFFMSIFLQFFLKILFPSYKAVFFMQHEKLAGDLTRFSLFTIYMLSFWFSVKIILFLIPIIVIVLALFYYRMWRHLISPRYITVRLTLDLLTATACFYFLILVYL